MTAHLSITPTNRLRLRFYGKLFLGLEGQANLFARGGRLILRASPLRLRIPVAQLSLTGGSLGWAQPSVQVRAYPRNLPISGGQFNLTSDTFRLSPGPLPEGLELVDKEDGTAHLIGMPLLGTAGTYTVPLKASNAVQPYAQQELLLIIDELEN